MLTRITAEYQMFGDVEPSLWFHNLFGMAKDRGIIKDYDILYMDFTRAVTCVYTFRVDIDLRPGLGWEQMNEGQILLNRILNDTDVIVIDCEMLPTPPEPINTSADYGVAWSARVRYSDGGKSRHGPFPTKKAAKAWRDARYEQDDESVGIKLSRICLVE